MSKKLLKCKDFACQLTSGLIAIVDDEAVIIKYNIMLNDNTTTVIYVPVSNVNHTKTKYMSNTTLLTTYITVDED